MYQEKKMIGNESATAGNLLQPKQATVEVEKPLHVSPCAGCPEEDRGRPCVDRRNCNDWKKWKDKSHK